ncbi:MAG: protease modulator HflC [Spirochaetia bacterium]
MKRLVVVLVVIAVAIIIFLILGPFYIVEEGEQAVVIRFGDIIKSTTDAGLHIKTPLVDTVVKYPKRIMSWDGQPRLFPTEEQQFIFVDTTARWRIVNPELFYERLTTIDTAFGRLDDIIESALATVIARNPIYEAVRTTNIINEIERGRTDSTPTGDAPEGIEQIASLITTVETQETLEKGRTVLSHEMLADASRVVDDFGIELIDVVIRQIRYSDDLTNSVYDRMVSERQRIARAYRSLGEGRKELILGELVREKNRIISEAFATSEQIRGEADAVAAETYSGAYRQDPDFFEFWRAIESYREILPRFQKTLTTDMEYFRYLYSETGQ